MAYKYKAFISYSWADKAWSSWLHRALETYRTPRALIGRQTARGPAPSRLHPIFKDREEEAAGASIGASIETAMRDSEFLIVLCSPRSAQSKWVNREVAWFKTHREAGNILAVIIDGEPLASQLPGRELEECFPKTLIYKVGSDLQPTPEAEDAPLAADARETGDGRRGAKLKLAAAMLGLGLDDLVRRDDRRRAARRRLVTSAALGVSAAMAFLAFDANRARIAAEKARNEAVAAKDAAEAAEKEAKFQRDDAQGLIEFMLTDFRKELDSLGRLDVLERTAKRLLESYSKQDIAKLDANALGRRARALLLLGEVDNTRGDLGAALARYEEAAATTGELLRRNPESAQQIFDHAQSVFWVGYIAWQRGDAQTAKTQFTLYHDLARQLVAIDPDKDEWQAELDYAYSNLGTLALDGGNAAEAEGYFSKSLEISSRILDKQPDSMDRLFTVGQSYAWLADALHRQTKLEEAIAARKRQIALYEGAPSGQKENAALLRALSDASYRLAQAEVAAGRLDDAQIHGRRAADVAAELLKRAPDSFEQADRSSFSRSYLGEIAFHLGRFAEARAAVSEALAISRPFLQAGEEALAWRNLNLSHPMLLQAKILAAEGNPERARQIYGEIVDRLRAPVVARTADPVMLRRYCEALAGRARLAAGAADDWGEIADRLDQGAGPEALVILAEAYLRLGRAHEAASIAAGLHAAGFRHPEFIALQAAFPTLMAASEENARRP